MSSIGVGGISYSGSGGGGSVLLTAGYSEDIKLYDVLSGEMIKTIGGPGSRIPGVEGVGLPMGAAQYGNVIDGHVNCLELTPDSRFVAAAGNPWVRIFDCEYTSAPYTSYEGGHRDNVTSVSFEEDAKWFVTSSEDGTAKIWDRRAPTEDEKSFQMCFKNQQAEGGGGGAIHCAVLHPNQAEVICGDASGQVVVWDLTANQVWTEVPDSGGSPIKSIAVAPTYADPSNDDVTVVAANHKGFCFPWRVSGEQCSATPPRTPELQSLASFKGLDSATPPATSSASEGTAGGESGSISPQDTPTIDRLSEFGESFEDDVESSSWVPLNVLDAHDAYILKVRFAPGPAKLLATCSSDGTAQIWQAHSDGFARQCGFNGHPRWVWDCAFGADRRSFYTACSDGVVRLWDLSNSGQQQMRGGLDRPLREYRAPKARAMGITSIALIEGQAQSPMPSRLGWPDMPQGSDIGKTLQELDEED